MCVIYVRNSCDTHELKNKLFCMMAMNNKQRSSVSKNSNSLNGLIKKTSMTSNNIKKITSIATAILMLSVVGTFGFNDSNNAFAKKPQQAIDWSNGFPSGEHSTMNIHGKKAGYNCDNSLEGTEMYGSSVFVPMNGTAEIDIVSNKRSSITEGKAIDPCAAPFGNGTNIDPALYQLPTGEHQVYWRILGIPNNGNGQGGNDGSSNATIAFPKLIDQCNFLPEAFEDGTVVQSFDPDVGLDLVQFDILERHTVSGDFLNSSSIYYDADDSGNVTDTIPDELVYGNSVALGTDLFGFNSTETHENTGLTPAFFDPGETIYHDVDMSENVTAGDVRIANAASQGLSGDLGGDAVSCEDDTLVGLGMVNNQGAFKKTGSSLERFGDETEKGKGKSKAVEITDLFLWSGVVCDASLDTVAPLGELTPEDFGYTADELALLTGDLAVPLTEEEFSAFLATQDECTEYTEEWVFNVADIVLYGFDYVNNGASLTQIRFYPMETTEFIVE